MSGWDAPASGDPFEANGDGGLVVQPLIDRRQYAGAEGLRTLPVDGRFESADPASFEATITSAQLGALVLRRIAIAPHRAIIDGHDRGVQEDLLRFIVVMRGSFFAAPPGGAPVRLGTGDALFTCRPRTYAYQASEPLVLVTSTLPVASLPALVRHLEDLPIGPLPHSPLVDAVVLLLSNLADRLDEPWTFDADYAARGLIDLEVAILSEVIEQRPAAPGPDRVYSAAVDYIERHLADPDLRPPQIAEALGVSLRYLHRAFDNKEVTVARHLRTRRLQQVAATLTAAPGRPSLLGLAARFGFVSQDQLARAFRRQYGVTMTEYSESAEARQDAAARSSIGMTGQSRQSRSNP